MKLTILLWFTYIKGVYESAGRETPRDADDLLDDNCVFGQNITEHIPAPSRPVTLLSAAVRPY